MGTTVYMMPPPTPAVTLAAYTTETLRPYSSSTQLTMIRQTDSVRASLRPTLFTSTPATSGPRTAPRAINEPIHDDSSEVMSRMSLGSRRRGRVGEVQVKQLPIEKDAMFAAMVIELGNVRVEIDIKRNSL